ncbi:hypothetical protein [Thiomicrospira sp.]|uniref:hypothetical protein n=1 Tax=Thiomicrospira sp. TaxID=935 RepID=UPI002F957EA4
MNISGSAMNNAYTGIQTGFKNLELNSQKIASPNVVDKAEPLIMHKLDANLVETNAKVIKTSDEMLGSLIDVMA